MKPSGIKERGRSVTASRIIAGMSCLVGRGELRANMFRALPPRSHTKVIGKAHNSDTNAMAFAGGLATKLVTTSVEHLTPMSKQTDTHAERALGPVDEFTDCCFSLFCPERFAEKRVVAGGRATCATTLGLIHGRLGHGSRRIGFPEQKAVPTQEITASIATERKK
mmetsp:Transcript_41211/g.113684  ORF Transcript_41211/g.113684 Transcript_41211/m.113684 type:complete len:166 (-) Transcript_41211:116-613(-)